MGGCARRDFYVRQLWDSKTSADITQMRPSDMALYTRLCAWTLARAHARSGDAITIAAYLGSSDVIDRAIAAFAEAYADQNEGDASAGESWGGSRWRSCRSCDTTRGCQSFEAGPALAVERVG